MNIFKTKQGRSEVYSIIDDYITVTGKKAPYCIKDSSDEKLYAVCPVCDNPIQIIGFYKNTSEAGRKPYGRHLSKDFAFAKYNHENYLDCPFSNPNWTLNNTLRQPDNPLCQNILDIVINQFDRIIYILSKDSSIRIGVNKAEQMLIQYFRVEGWRYRDASLLNVPWKFAEAQEAIPLFGSYIKMDSELYTAIKKRCPEIILKPDKNNEYSQIYVAPNSYCNLYFLFHKHKIRILPNNDLDETIIFWVYRGPVPEPETIYKKTIKISTTYFQNLIAPSRDNINRNYSLLNIAEKIQNQ